MNHDSERKTHDGSDNWISEWGKHEDIKPKAIEAHALPATLSKLGFEHVPAVPVDLAGMVDTLFRLGIKTKQYQQALQGLSRT